MVCTYCAYSHMCFSDQRPLLGLSPLTPKYSLTALTLSWGPPRSCPYPDDVLSRGRLEVSAQDLDSFKEAGETLEREEMRASESLTHRWGAWGKW